MVKRKEVDSEEDYSEEVYLEEVASDELYSETPTKKELYYLTHVKIRCHMKVAREIRDRLRPGSARSELFRATCFGPWLDIQSTSNDPSLVHLLLQTEYTPIMNQDALFFHVGGQTLRFGPQEFCLITGLRFGPHHLNQERVDMTYRNRVFGHVQGRPKVTDLKNVFDHSLDQLSDLDAVRVCLMLLVEVGFMGCDPKTYIDSILLELVEDLDSWNSFSWGSYVWKVVYKQLHNALEKRAARHGSVPCGRTSYSLSGFIWAFKIWIFEAFPLAKQFATKHDRIPRAISWGKNQYIKWKLALPFVKTATKPGFEPLPVLTPTPAECDTDWWRASCQFFDRYSSPLLNKAHLPLPPQQLVMIRDQLADDIDDATTMITTMPSSDNTTSHQSTQSGAKMVVKVSSQSDTVSVQGYKVNQSIAPILESIFNKHGDIAADCIFKPASVRSSFLEIICEVVSRIQTNNDIDMEEIEQQVQDAEAVNINVSWLRVQLDSIRKKPETSGKFGLLMEMKANTGLVRRAALMDLRESCMEMMAAQERFIKAERCVRVLHLVENNLNDRILESKGKI